MTWAAPTSPAVRTCGCGCGAPVVRRYRPGHDARHKAALVAQLADPHPIRAWEAAEALDGLAWSGFAHPGLLRAIPYRDRRRRAIPHIEDVRVWQVDHLGGHHSHRGCRTLTTRARSAGGLNRVTRLASDTYVRFLDNQPWIWACLPFSWDLCVDCSTPNHRDEVVEHWQVLKTESARAWNPKPRPAPAPKPNPWSAPHPSLLVQAA